MKIFVKVKPSAKEDEIEKLSENSFYISVKEPPVKGRANRAVIEALSEYFDLPKSEIEIVAGQTSKQKIINIGDLNGTKA